MKKESIKITGYRGRWSEIDRINRDGKNLYLMEHDTYGDMTEGLIIDDENNVVLDDVWNGFDDYFYAVETGYIEG